MGVMWMVVVKVYEVWSGDVEFFSQTRTAGIKPAGGGRCEDMSVRKNVDIKTEALPDEAEIRRRRTSITLSPKIYGRLNYFKQKYEERLGKQISWDDFFSMALLFRVFDKMVEGSE
jgi:hypothetical protein